MPDLPPATLCHVVAVRDADTITFQGGLRIRLAGISAREVNGSCNSSPDCPTMRAHQATPIARRLMLCKTIRFRCVIDPRTGRYAVSGKRIVGENYAIRCQLNASGATVPWRRYMAAYRLRECGR